MQIRLYFLYISVKWVVLKLKTEKGFRGKKKTIHCRKNFSKSWKITRYQETEAAAEGQETSILKNLLIVKHYANTCSVILIMLLKPAKNWSQAILKIHNPIFWWRPCINKLPKLTTIPNNYKNQSTIFSFMLSILLLRSRSGKM